MNESKPENPKERGQSLVELAMSILFLIILVAGVIDLGRAFLFISPFVMLLRKVLLMRQLPGSILKVP